MQNLARNVFFIPETETEVENGVFGPVPVSTPFSHQNAEPRHVSGNIDHNAIIIIIAHGLTNFQLPIRTYLS